MTKQKSTKRALLMSGLALLMCVSMLIGSTFAWFTDSVSSANNIIKSGNLDVELYYATQVEDDGTIKDSSWNKVTSTTNIFDESLWEPGKTEVVYFKIVNEGTLALKYNLGIKVAEETQGINVENKPFKLSDYIKFGVNIDTEKTVIYKTREEARDAVENISTKLNVPYSTANSLLPKKDTDYASMVVYMPEDVGNEANYLTGTTPPSIKLGINLFATQYTYEDDSYGPDYDKDAVWTGAVNTAWYDENPNATTFTIDTAEELAGLAKLVNEGTDTFANKTIKLGANIDLNKISWTPIGNGIDWAHTFNGSFNGNGYTIYNLYVVGGSGVGLFGHVGNAAHFESVSIDGAYVSGNDYVGAVMGTGYLAANCIKNCTVKNATVIATPFKQANGEYDGGAKAGVIAGYAKNGNISGNKVVDCTVIAYRDLGGIVGMVQGENRAVTVENNTVEKVTLSYVGVAGKYAESKVNENMNEVAGRTSNATVAENTIIDVTMNEANKGAIMIFTVEELIAFANDVNAENTYAGKTVLLGADIDLNNMEWTPIGTGAGFNGIFDGQEHVISNLKITGNKSTVGLFANTHNGEIKNLTIENAIVSGRLNVGVVAGNPYTSKYTNITVTGHVEVNGMSYVGGVGGKNAYANWTDIVVNVDEDSYVKAISTENGTAYRTYVGGVVGFNGEGGHTFKNITSNIDVIGDVCDIGGVFGMAHYNNKFVNITCTGDVTNLISSENDGDDAATDVLETGLIAGVWHNADGTSVSFTNIKATGTIKTPNVNPAEAFANNGLIGKKYSASGTGILIIDGKDADNNWVVTDVESLSNALANGGSVKLYSEVTISETLTVAEGTTVVLNLNGKTVTGKIDKDAGGVINNNGTLTITGGTLKNTTTNGDSVVVNNGTMVLKSATIVGAPIGATGYPAYALNNSGDMVIEEGANISSDRGALVIKDNGKTTINGGTFTNNDINRTLTSHVVDLSDDAEGHTLVINGGTFRHLFDETSGGVVICNRTKTTITVNGGNFSGGNYYGNNNLSDYGYGGTFSVTGGVFTAKPADKYIADGYVATKNADGTYTVVKGVANVADLNKALAAGGKVVLVDDIELTSTLQVKKDVVIDLNGNTITAPASGNMFHSSSDSDPSITITSSVAGAEINISGGDTAVVLGYGSTVISNVTINVTGCDNYSPNPFNVHGDLTLGEGTVVNVDYLGTALISNTGAHAIVIDGAQINVGTFKVNGGAMISLTKGTTVALNNTKVNVGLDTTYTSYFIKSIKEADDVTIEDCTFTVTDTDGNSYDIQYKADAAVGDKYIWVQK